MSRKPGNRKLTKGLPEKVMTSGASAATVDGSNALPVAAAPFTPAAGGLWTGRNLSSSSSGGSENSSSGESDGDNDNDNDNESSSSKSGSGSSSGSSSGESESEDDAAFLIDKYFREKYKDKLKVVFKAELPTVQNVFAITPPVLMRVPNFMPVEVDAYEEHTYQSSITQDDLKDNESRMAFISKLKTTIRWRVIQDAATGATKQESNTRLVRWSDGSQTLHVGDEAFDVIRHPVSGVQNQLYICLGNYYRQQCQIKEKITLRPKLESDFCLNHVQGLRKRALNKPTSNCVKILTDLTTNPVLDRERKIKEEWAQTRKEKCQQRREQLNQQKPSVKPMRHYTADDFEANAPMQQPYKANLNNPSCTNTANLNEINRSSGIRTNRNTDIKVPKYEEGSDDYNDLENLSDDSD